MARCLGIVAAITRSLWVFIAHVAGSTLVLPRTLSPSLHKARDVILLDGPILSPVMLTST